VQSIAAIVLIAVLALVVRAVSLEHRPFHGDEANQAYKTGQLIETGRYVYDPHDHHGPTLYYAAAGLIWLLGIDAFEHTETWMYRFVPVVFSAATLLALLLVRDALGRVSTPATAILLAFSPAFTFYSRYFIQETLLVFFTVLAMGCAWRYARRPAWTWAAGIGLSVSLMHATKETAAISVAAGGIALTVALVWKRGLHQGFARIADRVRWRHVVAALLVGLAANLVLFSAFFTHPRGPLDSLLTYLNYVERAGGAGMHDKPWHYYLGLLAYTKRAPGPWWSEATLLAAAAAGLVYACFAKRPRDGNLWFMRFVAVYAVTIGAVYAAIPYKTPWSMLSFYLALVLLAGSAVGTALRAAPAGWRRILVLLACAIGLTHLAIQSYRAETVYAADVRNPYVYAHTSTAFLRLVERIESLADIAGDDLKVQVIQPDRDYWPLPWYLRDLDTVGYWHEVPDAVDADVVIADPAIRDEVEANATKPYFGPESHGLRPAVLRAVYIDRTLWNRFLETRVDTRQSDASGVAAP